MEVASRSQRVWVRLKCGNLVALSRSPVLTADRDKAEQKSGCDYAQEFLTNKSLGKIGRVLTMHGTMSVAWKGVEGIGGSPKRES